MSRQGKTAVLLDVFRGLRDAEAKTHGGPWERV